MKISLFNPGHTQETIQLFTEVFAAAANHSEGELIGDLVDDLIRTTESQDLIGFITELNDELVAAVFFSRFIVPSQQQTFLLSPVAVATKQQGKGIGQRLIQHGLKHLKTFGTDLVFTYGDPRFYSKLGFESISEDRVKAPLILSQPEGWLAQSLSGESVPAMSGACRCVSALNHQKYW